jgi:hypothetical protein
LRELRPGVARIGVLVDPKWPISTKFEFVINLNTAKAFGSKSRRAYSPLPTR